MLHRQPRLVTIYVWQRMAVSTEHQCKHGQPASHSACLAGPRQVLLTPASLLTCRHSHLVSWVEQGTLMEVPQACYQMILSPYLRTVPPSLDSPRSQLQSWHPKLCQGGRRGGVDSRQAPLSSSHRGSFQHEIGRAHV